MITFLVDDAALGRKHTDFKLFSPHGHRWSIWAFTVESHLMIFGVYIEPTFNIAFAKELYSIIDHFLQFFLSLPNDFRRQGHLYHVIEAEVLISELVGWLPLWDHLMVQTLRTWSRAVKDPYFVAPHVLEQFM